MSSAPRARHVAIIMDGNGRWAKRPHLPRAMGHQKGVETVRRLAEIRGTTPEDIAGITTRNFDRLCLRLQSATE